MKEWQDMRRHVAQLTDKLGMPVDKKIVDTVTALRLLGLETSMSCSGHIRRFTGGPYVIFLAPKAQKYALRCKEINDPSEPAYKRTRKKALEENMREQQKLYHLLEGFYARHTAPFEQRLIVRALGFDHFQLLCQSADMARVMTLENKRQLLTANQAEMTNFTQYLKEEILSL